MFEVRKILLWRKFTASFLLTVFIAWSFLFTSHFLDWFPDWHDHSQGKHSCRSGCCHFSWPQSAKATFNCQKNRTDCPICQMAAQFFSTSLIQPFILEAANIEEQVFPISFISRDFSYGCGHFPRGPPPSNTQA